MTYAFCQVVKWVHNIIGSDMEAWNIIKSTVKIHSSQSDAANTHNSVIRLFSCQQVIILDSLSVRNISELHKIWVG